MIHVLVAAALAVGCRAAAAPQKPARPVRVAAVEAMAPAAGARYSANIVPSTQVTLSFRASGYVDGILQGRDATGRPRDLQGGDLVGAGVTLARVREGDYREQMARAAAQAGEAEAALAKARFDLERAEALFTAESLTRPDLDAARTGADAAAARAEAARASVALARISLGDTALRSPFAGLVIQRQVERGSLVAPGTVGFVLADVRSVKAIFGVPDGAVNRLAVGVPLVVTSDAIQGREFEGRVSAVSPAADPQTRVFTVEVTIANSDRLLKPGMIATVAATDMPAGHREGRHTSVPLAAVVSGGAEGYAVFIVDARDGNAVARRRPVALGEVAGNSIEVRSGVAVGEQVVVAGATLVKDGDPVRVIP
jgi:multidrug efflux system membrane fusion protein